MKYLILYYSIFIFQSSFAQTDTLNRSDSLGKKYGYWIIYGKDKPESGFAPDAIMEEGRYADGKKTGTWSTYYLNAQKKSEVEYKNNRPNGKFKLYYENGQLEEEGTWKFTRFVGEYKRYWDYGCISQHKFFGDDGKTILYILYYASDTCFLKQEEYNQDGKKMYVSYNRKGEVTRSDSFYVRKNQERELTFIPMPGSYVEKTFTKKPDTTSHSKNDGEESGCPCKAHVNDGENVIFNTLNKITLEGEFRNNALYTGKCHRYQNDTTLVQVAVYKEGKYYGDEFIQNFPCATTLDGYHKLYNANKQISKDGEFKSCQLFNGKQYLYDKNGLITRILIYKNGKYFADGDLD